jgi:hypothetical protein
VSVCSLLAFVFGGAASLLLIGCGENGSPDDVHEQVQASPSSPGPPPPPPRAPTPEQSATAQVSVTPGTPEDLTPPPAHEEAPAAGARASGSPTGSGEKVLVDGKWEIEVVSAGYDPFAHSAVANAPGYRPPDDPEIESVYRGRREVERIDAELAGGAPSATWLAQMILDCIREASPECLAELAITKQEFVEIMWPEFPQSRAATNVSAQSAWFFLYHHSSGGINRALTDLAGMELQLKELTFDIGLTRYANFNLYRGVNIHALKPAGEEVVFDFAFTWVEKDGIWKVYVYKD